jgi:Domain of unknown function (DUF6249)
VPIEHGHKILKYEENNMIAEISSAFASPFIVPVAATIMVPAIIAVVKLNEYNTRKLQFEERMALISKGLPLPATLEASEPRNAVNPLITKGFVRRSGIVLVSLGIGLAAFFITLSNILQERDVLSGAAIAIIPFAIGIGLLIDVAIQAREIASGAMSRHMPPERI